MICLRHQSTPPVFLRHRHQEYIGHWPQKIHYSVRTALFLVSVCQFQAPFHTSCSSPFSLLCGLFTFPHCLCCLLCSLPSLYSVSLSFASLCSLFCSSLSSLALCSLAPAFVYIPALHHIDLAASLVATMDAYPLPSPLSSLQVPLSIPHPGPNLP